MIVFSTPFADMKALQKTIGYKFRHPELLEVALTHTSHAEATQGKHDFERLEFLGDSVIGLVVSDVLYHLFPDEREGDLARRKAMLVSRQTLARLAEAWGLGEALRLSGREEAAGGRRTRSTLEDACEAVIGAIYLDGGWKKICKVLEPIVKMEAEHYHAPPQDPRTALQEWAQGRGLPLPEYKEIARRGEAHAPVFVMEVCVNGARAEGQGNSKKAAAASAAAAMLKTLGECG